MNDFKTYPFSLLPPGEVFKIITSKQLDETEIIDEFLKYHEIHGVEFEKISETEIKNIADLESRVFLVKDLSKIFPEMFVVTNVFRGWDYITVAVYRPLNLVDYFLNCSWQFLVGLIFGTIPILSLFVIISSLTFACSGGDSFGMFKNHLWRIEPLPKFFKIFGFLIGLYFMWKLTPVAKLWINSLS